MLHTSEKFLCQASSTCLAMPGLQSTLVTFIELSWYSNKSFSPISWMIDWKASILKTSGNFYYSLDLHFKLRSLIYLLFYNLPQNYINKLNKSLVTNLTMCPVLFFLTPPKMRSSFQCMYLVAKPEHPLVISPPRSGICVKHNYISLIYT